MTAENPKAVYACINYGESVCPKEIEKKSICIDGDIGDVLCHFPMQPYYGKINIFHKVRRIIVMIH